MVTPHHPGPFPLAVDPPELSPALLGELGAIWAELLTADLFDPRPERVRYAVRAAFLVWIYAWGIASDVVAKGGAAKPEADAVTRGMTASVVACTLWVVAWELVTVLVVV